MSGQNLYAQTETATGKERKQTELVQESNRELRRLRLLYRTVEQWEQGIQQSMLEQDFHKALALCLEAQQQYPAQARFHNYELSIREFLLLQETSITSSESSEQQVEAAGQAETQRATLRERLVAFAQQDPFLALHAGLGLHQGSSLAEEAERIALLNPFSEAAIDLYFTPSIGLQLFYYDSHWDLILSPKTDSKFNLHSLFFGGSLRFQNKFNILIERSALRFAVDLGIGIYDMLPVSAKYEPQPVIILGFRFTDRPFYHFGGIEILAGLKVDLSFSLLLSMQSNAPSVVQTGNWEIKLWQTLGLFRLGLSYRGSFSEYYEKQRLLFLQHQFAVLVGLEWRTSFR